MFTRRGELRCFIEIKKRNIKHDDYSDIIIDKAKIDLAWGAANKIGIGFNLVFEFVDGVFVFVFAMDKDPAFIYETTIGGRTVDKREENDIDMVYKLPSSKWMKL